MCDVEVCIDNRFEIYLTLNDFQGELFTLGHMGQFSFQNLGRWGINENTPAILTRDARIDHGLTDPRYEQNKHTYKRN